MKLIKSSFEIITKLDGEQILKDIEKAARDCYQSDGKIEYASVINGGNPNKPHLYCSSARVIIPKLISLGHEAMLEFGGMIHVRFICDRGVSHEFVRHRVFSFAQESTRYCNYSKDKFNNELTFIAPLWLDYKQLTELNSSAILDQINSLPKDMEFGPDEQQEISYLHVLSQSEVTYLHLSLIHI